MAAAIGTTGWLDLTVDDADGARDFYADVLGWRPEPVPMQDGAYADYTMMAGDIAVGGVCHKRGENAGMPSGWVPYFVVASLEASLAAAVERGATVVERRTQMAALRDPSGATFAIWQG